MAGKSSGSAQTFRAVLERGDRSLGWTIARVPFAPSDVWPQMVRLRVRGTINGFVFRTSLFLLPGKENEFFLLVNKTMQHGGRVGLGGAAEIVLRPDLEAREAELPDELAVLLDEEEGLRTFYDGMTEYARREIGKWIAGITSEDARMRRVQQMAERLMLTMEGERELPPIIEGAFRLRPRARAGWKKMTALQRRHELFAVFYYRTPESQAKRVQGLCDAAEKKAG